MKVLILFIGMSVLGPLALGDGSAACADKLARLENKASDLKSMCKDPKSADCRALIARVNNHLGHALKDESCKAFNERNSARISGIRSKLSEAQ